MKHRVETLETKIVNFRSFELQTHCNATKERNSLVNSV